MAFFGFRKKESTAPAKVSFRKDKKGEKGAPKQIKKAEEASKEVSAPKKGPEGAKLKPTKPTKVSSGKIRKVLDVDASKILIRPRITEKAAILAEENNAYTFMVHRSAGKKEIADAISNLYNVKPIRVNVLKVPRKKIISRGKVGMKAGGKKAVVYLKEGDKIEFV